MTLQINAKDIVLDGDNFTGDEDFLDEHAAEFLEWMIEEGWIE